MQESPETVLGHGDGSPVPPNPTLEHGAGSFVFNAFPQCPSHRQRFSIGVPATAAREKVEIDA